MLFAVLLISTLSLFSCNNEAVETTTPSDNQTENTGITNPEITETGQISVDVDAETFKSLLDTGAGILIDVRTPEEFAEGHMKQAVNLDFNGANFEQDLDLLSRDRPVYVYCQSGGRSGKAKELMNDKGFSAVYNLVGGYGNWPYKE